MIKQKEMQSFSIDLPIDSINLNAYKHCAIDYFKGIGPWGSPFTFLSYGINYSQMLFMAKFSVEFINFLFAFIFSDIKNESRYKVLDFLAEAGLTAAEIKEKIQKYE